MISVTYYRTYNRITIEGHAESGELGRDLICAGASILAHTLAANVSNLYANGQIRDAVTDLQPGKAEISCNPKNNYRALVGRIFESVCVGFEIMAQKSPEYISYEIHY